MTKDIDKALEDFMREMRAELKQSVDHCSETYHNVNLLSQELKALREELVITRKANEKLVTENRQLQIKVEELKQYTRANNLEIKGAPNEGESFEIVKKLCAAIQEPVTESDIDTCHRMGISKEGTRSIVVRFVRRDKRNAVLMKARKVRPSARKIGLKTSAPIFVNENLTRQGKQLLGAAVATKREVGWRFVWTQGGKIFARKSERLGICCREDINKMH